MLDEEYQSVRVVTLWRVVCEKREAGSVWWEELWGVGGVWVEWKGSGWERNGGEGCS